MNMLVLRVGQVYSLVHCHRSRLTWRRWRNRVSVVVKHAALFEPQPALLHAVEGAFILLVSELIGLLVLSLLLLRWLVMWQTPGNCTCDSLTSISFFGPAASRFANTSSAVIRLATTVLLRFYELAPRFLSRRGHVETEEMSTYTTNISDNLKARFEVGKQIGRAHV